MSEAKHALAVVIGGGASAVMLMSPETSTPAIGSPGCSEFFQSPPGVAAFMRAARAALHRR